MVKVTDMSPERRSQRQSRKARELPPPPKPIERKPFRGFLLRLPEAYYSELQEQAAAEGISMHQLALRLMYEGLTRR